jgi:hypothetical protein
MTAPPAGTFDRPQGDAYADEPSGSGSRTGLLLTLAVVAALIIGGGAFAVTRVLGGGGDQPASALPGGTAAYVRMDIDPSVGQKIAAVRFLEDLDPKVTETLNSEDMRHAFFDLVAEDEPALAGIDYEADIEPWLGDRLGLGVVPQDSSEEPQVAVALQVKDQDAAEEGLNKLLEAEGGDEAGFFFHGDYAVISSAEMIDDVQAGVEAGTLAESDAFTSDLEALGDEGVLSFWMDSAALAPYLDEAGGAVEDLGEAPVSPDSMGGFLSGTGLADSGAAQGRVAAAVRFGEDHIEVHGVTRGHAFEVAGGDTAQLVLDLPEDTAVAFGQEHGDQYIAEVYRQLSEYMPDELAQFEEEAAAAGFTLPDDVQTLVGQSLAVGAGPEIANVAGMEDFASLPVAYRVQTDTEAANALIDDLLALSGADQATAEQFLVRRTDGDVLTLGVDQAYVDRVAEGGSLGGSSTFQSAVPNADSADSVLYIDLNAFESLYLNEIEDESTRASVEKIAAIGTSASYSGNNGEFTFRIVAD